MKPRPRTSAPRALLLPLALLSSLLGASPSLGGPADDKKACLASYERSQELRRQGGLKAAKDQFALCARPSCPKALSGDCTKWLEEVNNTIPTVVVEGRDTSGGETVSVKVSVDGQVVAERLDGRSIEVDPGMHTFRYEYGGKTLEEKLVIREGERNRKVTANFAPASTKPEPDKGPTKAAERPAATAAPIRYERPVRPITYAAGGFALAGFAGFAFFGLQGKSKASDLKGSCAPNCTDDQVKPLKTSYLIGDIFLGVGVVSVGVAALSYALRPLQQVDGAEQTGLHFDVIPTQNGGAAALRGAF
jgi:hypothetical protein